MSHTNIAEDIQEEVCKRHLEGINVNQLEKEFNLSRKVLERVLNKRGILKKRHEINRQINPILTDKEALSEMYFEKLMTIDVMANVIGVSTQLIRNAFKELDIRARSRRDSTITTFLKKTPDLKDESKVVRLYNQGLAISALAKQLKTSDGVIQRILMTNGVKIRSLAEQMELSRKIADKVSAKLAKNLRSRLSIALKNDSKRGSAVKDLGCSIDLFKEHLKGRFYDSDEGVKMTWDNYGKNGWELDHIKPLSSFDLKDKDQFKLACHYTNIAPVWRADNRAKSALPVGRLPKRVPLFILTGQSGSGKSWVTNHLKDKCQIISFDSIPKEQHYHYMVEMSHSDPRPIIYDPLRKAISIYRRYRSLFDTKFIVIVEEPEIIKSRIQNRGGKAINNIDKFYKKFKRLAAGAHFSGTSEEVLKYLKDKV